MPSHAQPRSWSQRRRAETPSPGKSHWRAAPVPLEVCISFHWSTQPYLDFTPNYITISLTSSSLILRSFTYLCRFINLNIAAHNAGGRWYREQHVSLISSRGYELWLAAASLAALAVVSNAIYSIITLYTRITSEYSLKLIEQTLKHNHQHRLNVSFIGKINWWK